MRLSETTQKSKPKAAKPAAKTALKTIAKKAVSKKVALEKVAVKKVAATKTVAKQAVANKAVANKAVANKAVAKKVVAKKTVVKNAAAKKVLTKALSKKVASGKKPAASGLPARTISAGEKLRNTVLKALDDMKAKDVVVIDVRQRTSITDDLVFASGTSTRHVKAIADEVVKAAKAIQMPPIGVEGEKEAEWVLVDLADIVVHVMLPKTREFYALERMWGSAGDPPNE
jgi:ribosome silencing factor RsfS/YbeB/iojap